MKPLGKINLKWTPNLAYIVGYIVADGYLSCDGRHIDITSVEKAHLEKIKRALGVYVKIGRKSSGNNKYGYRLQFGDILFYKFLKNIGLTPRKSKTLGKIMLPDDYFPHFLRGVFDGDGCTYSYFDPRWKNSFMLYLVICSASENFIKWLQKEIIFYTGAKGRIYDNRKRARVLQLRYAKKESLIIIKYMYSGGGLFLDKKKLKIKESLSILD